jgi:glutamyl-tRNA synthetase
LTALDTVPAPRVRFAPSPTGYFHVGSARTALFNWLFARRHGGVFILRIEDTDEERNREEWVHGIVSALHWLGMDPDEGPYRQSTKFERYQVAIDALWESGDLYACDCTRDAVLARTEKNATPGYDGFCRARGLPKEGNALRFRVPSEGETVVHDLVRGDVTFPHSALDDFVVVKSTGQPLFALANAIDDRDMQITHVIRGEELLPTTPRQLLLWRALDVAAEGEAGWGEIVAPPLFAHLPVLVNEQRKKLSKRKDPVAMELYKAQGFLPEAMRNYLALLGWSPPDDQEKVPVETLIEHFSLEDVNHSPAFFDVKKLTHLNGEYIRELPVAEFVTRSMPWLVPAPLPVPEIGAEVTDVADTELRIAPPPWPPERFDPAVFDRMAPVVQERVAVLGEVPRMVDFVFLADPPDDPDSWAKAIGRDDAAADLLASMAAAYETCDWAADAIKEVTVAVGEAAGRKLAKAQAPVRVAVTGRTVGPPLFESLEVLGRDEVLRRLGVAIDRTRSGVAQVAGGVAGSGPPAGGGGAGTA